jgi:hypothetical protein
MREASAKERLAGMPLAPLHPPRSSRVRSTLLVPDNYLTDGRRLFRVVSQFGAGAEHVFVSLENCLTLEIQAYAPGELDAMRLRPVRTPAGR